MRARVFCASLADVFEGRPELAPWRAELFRLIEATPWLDWLLLTKRPENMVPLAEAAGWLGDWPANVWAGTTVEDQRRADERIPILSLVPARIRFLSCEPLLERVELGKSDLRLGSAGPWLSRIHWVIVGGESGGSARTFVLEWARHILDRCKSAPIPRPVFVKQLGAKPADFIPFTGGLELVKLQHGKGEDLAEWPEALRVQELPQ